MRAAAAASTAPATVHSVGVQAVGTLQGAELGDERGLGGPGVGDAVGEPLVRRRPDVRLVAGRPSLSASSAAVAAPGRNRQGERGGSAQAVGVSNRVLDPLYKIMLVPAQPFDPADQLGGRGLGTGLGRTAAGTGDSPPAAPDRAPRRGGRPPDGGALDPAQPPVVGADGGCQVLDPGHQAKAVCRDCGAAGGAPAVGHNAG